MKLKIAALLLVFVQLINIQKVIAQDVAYDSWEEQLKSFKIQPILSLQLWSTYSMGMTVFNEESGAYEKVDNRLNNQIRRTRLGIKGQPYKNLKFKITSALDLVGKDLLSATQGGGNNGASPAFRLWNALLQWKVFEKNDALHFSVGYLTPQIGRESITGAMNVSSMEKSWSQNYLRRQLVGTGPGRAVGFNFGGLFLDRNNKFSFGYDLGFYNPVNISLSGNSVGEKFAPLSTARVVFYLGDPESETYTLSHKVNYHGQRKGCSIALSAAYQGETTLFKRNLALGTDLLFNWGRLNLDGEWTFLAKASLQSSEAILPSFKVKTNTGYLRISYNLQIARNRILEPAFMLVQFNGATDLLGQKNAMSLNAFAGKDYAYDFGVNYYFNPKLKFSLHYTFRSADMGAAEKGADFNNYYYQSGVGAIQRGDWLGVGFVAIF